MSDGDDEYAIRRGTIYETLWEPWHQNAPEPRCEGATALWEGDQPAIGGLDCRYEVEPQIFRLRLVMPRSRDELCLGLGMERYGSHRSEDRAFSMTRSAGTGLTPPDSSSSMRRSASRIQSSWESGSAD